MSNPRRDTDHDFVGVRDKATVDRADQCCCFLTLLVGVDGTDFSGLRGLGLDMLAGSVWDLRKDGGREAAVVAVLGDEESEEDNEVDVLAAFALHDFALSSSSTGARFRKKLYINSNE